MSRSSEPYGILKVVPVLKDPPPTLASPVTGHNLHKISYMVSKAAENGGFAFKFEAGFDTDGSLVEVIVPSPLPDHVGKPYRVPKQAWVFLSPGGTGLSWGDEGHPVRSGHFREVS